MYRITVNLIKNQEFLNPFTMKKSNPFKEVLFTIPKGVIGCLAIFFFLSYAFDCRTDKRPDIKDKSGPVKDTSDIEVEKKYSFYHQSALFASGLDVPPDSIYKELSNHTSYKKFKTKINKLWNDYEINKIKKIEKWREKHFPKDLTNPVFYPFSGPDIVNALAFFPEAQDYIMIGLENPGDVPDVKDASVKNIIRDLNNLSHGLRTYMKMNFFRTSEMANDFRKRRFSGFLGVIMFFLASYDCVITDIKYIYLDKEGKIQKNIKTKKKNLNTGIEISFYKTPEKINHRLIFLQVNVDDKHLKKNPILINFLKSQGRLNIITKAASYLMHYSTFSAIRSYLIKHGDFIIQTDSGVPLKYFKEDTWDLRYFGKYKVLKMFKDRYQKDLASIYKKKNPENLPFSYGYGGNFTPHKSNLMVAIRKKKDED
jgi:hypothetical protein